MKIVMISDTHGLHDKLGVLPEGNVLVHAGDLTNMGKIREIQEVAAWLNMQRQYFDDVVVIAGNHDFGCEAFMKEGQEGYLREIFGWVHYLRDSGVTLDGVKFWGSPWQPWFYDWAFNLPLGASLEEKWNLIPADTDVLITHGPPKEIRDSVPRGGGDWENVGCYDLLQAVERIKPKVHVFGHIHVGYGRAWNDTTQFFNAAVANEKYEIVNKPLEVEL